MTRLRSPGVRGTETVKDRKLPLSTLNGRNGTDQETSGTPLPSTRGSLVTREFIYGGRTRVGTWTEGSGRGCGHKSEDPPESRGGGILTDRMFSEVEGGGVKRSTSSESVVEK